MEMFTYLFMKDTNYTLTPDLNKLVQYCDKVAEEKVQDLILHNYKTNREVEIRLACNLSPLANAVEPPLDFEFPKDDFYIK